VGAVFAAAADASALAAAAAAAAPRMSWPQDAAGPSTSPLGEELLPSALLAASAGSNLAVASVLAAALRPGASVCLRLTHTPKSACLFARSWLRV
jgi:hypothetical protein